MSSRTVDATAQLLTDEEETFQQHRSSLLRQAQGKYVVIRHKEVVGIYESELQALEEGTRQFGNTPFLIRQIRSVEEPLVIPTPFQAA